MTTKAHSTLTGSDLHEPKGASSATNGQVYVSDGAGSGSWQDTAATAGSNSFTTGDLKPTFKLTADSGWIMCDDGTIGDLSSGATTLASSTTSALYTLIWTNFANPQAAVSTGRGISAAADFAAHKTIALPKMLGRVYGVAGAGAGLTIYGMGQITGENTHILSGAEMPSHAHGYSGTSNGQSVDHTHGYNGRNFFFLSGASAVQAGTGTSVGFDSGPTAGTSQDHTHTYGGNTTAVGGDGAHNNMQPSVFLKMMVKL